ncbi:tenascin-N isoform X2 [Oncorhynchus masou masou]|uniref:tenascin-N isoform X2 n=1 Tax=Oncorhynchus masou masou TaxID=90313 RepID=UPI003183BE58
MTTRLHWPSRALCLIGILCTVTATYVTEDSPAPAEKGVTFSHIYKIDLTKSPGCKLALQTMPHQQDQGLGLQELEGGPTLEGDKDIVFRHQINLKTSKCDCDESEHFKSLLYRVNALEEEVEHLKSQCSQGFCGGKGGGAGGVDTSCSGHGTYQHDTCSCQCNPGWEGPDCSISTCPDECNDHGRCVDGKCVCLAGYMGSDCSQLMCPGDCNDKGHCVDGKCVCLAGYMGSDCSQLMCPGDCNDKGHCVDGKCVCLAGYMGSDCSQLMCPGDCNDKGHCVDGKCVCLAGYMGSDCSQLMCPGDCNDKGHCVDGKCVCLAGYMGSDCSQLMCPGDCNDKGHCVDGKCVCFSHFTGEDCSEQKCSPDCVHGTCVNGMCICDEGFFGDDCSAVIGPNGLRLVRVTDVSLLVEWQAVRAAEYYVLAWHPEGNEAELERVTVPNTETSYLITGLRPGVTYIVQVYAVIKEIQSEGDRIEATTVVSGIDGIRVLGQTEDSIQVDWQNPAAPLDHFRLTHANPDGQEEEQIVPMSAEARTTNTIVGLQPGTEYLITVQGIKGTIEGKASFVTGVTDLDAPTNLLTREVTEDTADVSWDRPLGDIDGYMISYSSAEGSSGEIPVGADSNSYRLTGLRPGVIYTVYIWAVKGSRVSRKSSTAAETEIDSPKNLKASDVKLDAATLTWTAPLARIDGYILTFRAEDGTLKTLEKTLREGESRFAMSDLEMGKNYIVTLLAYRGAKRSRVIETTFKTVGLLHPFPMDCTQIKTNGNMASGIYTIYINSDRTKPMEVYCDMDTDGGGWVVLQRRNNGQMDFMKRWRPYMAGFGNMTDEFWLGLDNIYELTNTPTQYELRVDLGVGSEKAYAVYDNFKIAPAKQKFKLSIGKYRGTAGDAMNYHQGRPFSTVDNDNDIALGNCALTHRGAWWYKNCHLANLNGKFGDNRHSMGVNWEPWKGHLMSLDFTEMKIRPVGAARKRRSLSSRTAPRK